MSKYNSNGEVYGSKVLTFAIIATSAAVLAGMVYSPAVQSQKTVQPAAEEVVVTAHPAPTSRVNG